MIFLKAVLLGAVIGCLYDVFRILRKAIHFGKIAIFIQDVLFWLLSALFTFFFLIAVNNGKLRGFILAGEILGGWIYLNSISLFILWIFDHLFHILHKINQWFFHHLISPIGKLLKQLLNRWNKISIKQKNIRRNVFLHLKNRVHLVYNKKNRNSKEKRNVV